MKKNIFLTSLLVAAFLTLAFLSQSSLWAGTAPKAGAPTATEYLIEVTHTPETCLSTLDEVKAQGADKLKQWNWGCMFGDHTGYCIVKAKSETEALSNVPESQRKEAKVLPLSKFSVEQIATLHKQMGK